MTRAGWPRHNEEQAKQPTYQMCTSYNRKQAGLSVVYFYLPPVHTGHHDHRLQMMVIGTEAVVQKARLSAESVIIRLIFRNPVTVPDQSLTDWHADGRPGNVYHYIDAQQVQHNNKSNKSNANINIVGRWREGKTVSSFYIHLLVVLLSIITGNLLWWWWKWDSGSSNKYFHWRLRWR